MSEALVSSLQVPKRSVICHTPSRHTHTVSVVTSSCAVNCIAESNAVVSFFYRAMHFSTKRGLAIACRLSVRL